MGQPRGQPQVPRAAPPGATPRGRTNPATPECNDRRPLGWRPALQHRSVEKMAPAQTGQHGTLTT